MSTDCLAARPLADRIVVVTGASRGLGAAMARELAAQGAEVIMLARSGDRLAAVESEITAAGGRARSFICDLTDQGATVSVAQEILDSVGTADVLVNNAGAGWDARTLDTSDEEIARLFAINVFAAMSVTRELGRAMTARGSGKIINIASAGGLVGMPAVTVYGASKAAIVHWTKLLAAEWARYGVTVNAVAPGFFLTEINSVALDDPAVRKRVLADVPLRRFGDEGQLARVVAFLCTDAADFITGQVLAVDGGISTAL